jgi:K+-transporting ATPase ATPase A chain
MVGRTPEYLGKKIEQKEVKMMMLAVLVLAVSILGFSAVSIGLKNVGESMTNHGPHGFAEVLYAFTSGTGNNGSAFAGLSANTPYLNTTIGLAMLFGRFLMLIPVLAAAGSLAQKKLVPVSSGTFPTHGPLFVVLLTGVIVIVGALTFFPALSLGPIVEHFLMWQGRLWS